jgi:hypothetical protein|tara:strand:+ start:1224 stop:1982 length:759 start_codon:yes stop_codon:yes gene_type:complete
MDLNKIKDRLNRLTTSDSQRSNVWKPSPGKQVVRIVPYKFDKEMPFIELYFHYGIMGKSILSPTSFGKPDPIKEFADKLMLSGNRDDYQLGRKLTPKLRTYTPLIVRGEETQGVRFWGFGKLVYQELLSFINDPDYGDISDIISGRDLTIEFKTTEETGSTYPQTLIRIKPNQTSLHDDKQIVDKWLSDQLSIDDIYKEYQYNELSEMLNSWLKGVPEEPQDEPTDETSSIVSTETEKSASDTFDELFNKSD